ncbi:MAG TPA: hypothetical protein PLI96_07945 [Halothiobacillus sp.]|nr:hypothetical protein [Halothiobacillus sp.]
MTTLTYVPIVVDGNVIWDQPINTPNGVLGLDASGNVSSAKLLKPGALVSETLLQAASDRGYSIREFNGSGSILTTTGTIASGSNTVTLAAAIDFANGQGINVAGAGTSGANLVTTIVSGAGTTTLILAASAATAVSNAAAIHDDSNAFQTAINTLVFPGAIARLFFPLGVYNVAWPMQNNGDNILAAIQLPYIPNTGIPATLILEGEGIISNYAEFTSSLNTPFTGTILNFTSPGAGLSNPTAISANSTGGFTAINLYMRNLHLRTPWLTGTGSDKTMLWLDNLANLNMDNVTIDTSFGSSLTGATEPQTANFALRTPLLGNYGSVRVNNVYIVGFFNGLLHSEHAVLDGVFIQCCRIGISLISGYHAAYWKRVLIQECAIPINGANLPIYGDLDLEFTTTGGNWYNTSQLIINGGGTTGEIKYNAVANGGVSDITTLGPFPAGLKFTNINGSRLAASSVTVTASPFAYTASQLGTVYVSGGTVSAITLTRRGVIIPTGVTSGAIGVATGDIVTITYSAAPTVNYVP